MTGLTKASHVPECVPYNGRMSRARTTTTVCSDWHAAPTRTAGNSFPHLNSWHPADLVISCLHKESWRPSAEPSASLSAALWFSLLGGHCSFYGLSWELPTDGGCDKHQEAALLPLSTVGACLRCEMRHAACRDLVFGLSNLCPSLRKPTFIWFHSMFRTIQHSPHWTNLSDFVFRATAHCAGLTGKEKKLHLLRASKKRRLVLTRISLASSCYGQKGRVEASVSCFEVFIAARNATHNLSQLRYRLINSQ